MHFSVLTIFPVLFQAFGAVGIIGRAVKQGHISIQAFNIRDFAADKHHVTDDRPYGGGSGMVMKAEPLADAVRAAKGRCPQARTILMTPQGRPFCQKTARSLVSAAGLILICGRYEGIDERILEGYVDLELSVGDYVLSGGELAAMIVMDAVTRLIPGVLGNRDSAAGDSFAEQRLAHPQYTRPAVFEEQAVPDVLLSGDHQKIENWRFETSIIRTLLKRPDLLKNRRLEPREIRILKKWHSEIEAIIDAQHPSGADALSGARKTW